MIPKLNIELRNEIRNHCHRIESEGKNWKWHLARRIRNFAAAIGLRTQHQTTFDSLFLLVLAGVLLCITFVAPVTLLSENWRDVTNFLSNENWTCHHSSLKVAAYGVFLLTVAFLAFAGGTSKRLHEISRLYPQPDVSLKRYIQQRTIAALIAVFVISLLVELNIARLSPQALGLFTFVHAVGVSALQAAFAVALVLLVARRYVPSFESILCMTSILGWLQLGLLSIGRFKSELEESWNWYPQFLVSDDLLQISNHVIELSCIPAWMTNAISSTARPADWTGLLLLLPITVVILCGVRSFKQLWDLEPHVAGPELTEILKTLTESTADSRDTSSQIQKAEQELSTANLKQEKGKLKEAYVFDRIDQLIAPPQTHQEQFFSFLPFAYRITLAGRRKPDKKLLSRPEPLSSKVKRKWAEVCLVSRQTPRWAWLFIIPLGSALLALPTLGIAGWFLNCFSASDSAEAQMFGLLTCFAIVVGSLFNLAPVFPHHLSSFLYPYDPWKSIGRTFQAWGKSLLYVLPLLGGLNLAFCAFYDFSAYQTIWFIALPLIWGLSLLLLGLGIQWTHVSRHSVISCVLLVAFAVEITFLLFVAVGALPFRETANCWSDPTLRFLANHSVEISAAVVLVTCLATMISLVALNHSRWVDIAEARSVATNNRHDSKGEFSLSAKWENQLANASNSLDQAQATTG